MTEKEQRDVVETELKGTGGPAFPIGIPEAKIVYTGMTLRDYFAAKAMQGLIAGTVTPETVWSPEDLAKSSYMMAYAMLKERLK